MRVPLIKDGVVVNVVELADDAEIVTAEQLAQKIKARENVKKCWVPPEGHIIGPDGGKIGDTWDGEKYIEPPVETRPLTLEDYERAISRHIDRVAQKRDYRNAEACASYALSTNEQWAAEANVFIAWRDSVWAYVFEQLDRVQNGEREQPTIADLLSELPV